MKDFLSLQHSEFHAAQLTMVGVDAMLKRAKKAAHEANAKETLELERKKSEKNEKKLKKHMKAEKHAFDNQKRIKSVKLKEAAAKNQKRAIQDALSSIDSVSSNKKIKFDSDSEDDIVTTDQQDKLIDSQPKEVTVGKSLKLFADDGSEDGSDAESDNDGINFRLRKEYEGPSGQKLMKLQSSFKGDNRFKLNERFATSDDESESPDDGDTSANEKTTSEIANKKELERNLGILASVVGNSVQQKPTNSLFKESVRYDPTRNDHQTYVQNRAEPVVENEKTKKEKVKKKKSVEPTGPEVSKEHFYKVETVVLKSALANENQDQKQVVFNFFGEDDEDDIMIDQNSRIEKNNIVEEIIPSNSLVGSDSPVNDESESEMENEEKELVATSDGTKIDDSFFFLPDDLRIKKGIESFFAEEDPDEIRSKWQDRREDLVELFKTLKRKRRSQNRMNMSSKGGSKRGRRYKS